MATLFLFALDGAGFGTWAAHIPSLKTRTGASHAELSTVLLALVAGGFLMTTPAGQWVRRWGSRPMLWLSSLSFCLLLVAIGWAPNLLWLSAAALLFGGVKGIFDLSVNAQAMVIQEAYGRPMFSTFQGMWCVGGLAGSLLSGALLGAGGTAAVNLTALGLTLAAACALCCRYLLGDRPPETASAGFRWPNSFLLRLGALAFIALFSEGAIADWSAVFLHEEAGLAAPGAALGYAVYSVAMAAGRFCGDRLTGRFGAVATLRASGLLAAMGLTAMLTLRTPAASFGGLVLAGFGLANAVPILLTAGARDPEFGPGPGIAAVTTLGYLGFLAGPPLIGALAGALGLAGAMGVLAGFGLVTASLAGLALTRPAA